VTEVCLAVADEMEGEKPASVDDVGVPSVQRLSSDGCLDAQRQNYQNCSVL